MLASSIAYIANWFSLKKWASDGADLDQPPNTEDKKTIWSVIRQQAPITIYYCIQGQTAIFIISFFGNTRNVAEMGALGRLTTLFALVNSVMAAMVVPRFTYYHERNKLKKIFLHTLFTLATLSVILIGRINLVAWPFPVASWIEICLSPTCTCLRDIFNRCLCFRRGYVCFERSRAWTKKAWLSIPITIVGQVTLAPFLNLSSVRDVILLNTIPAIIGSPLARQSLTYHSGICNEVRKKDTALFVIPYVWQVALHLQC